MTVNLLAAPRMAGGDAVFGALAAYAEARSVMAGRLLELEVKA